MATSSKPQKLEFNNVISMGVSYSWENVAGEGNALACSDLNRGKSLVKRTKNISLDVLNLDLANAGDSVIDFMANNQSKYVDGSSVDIHANGIYAGKGKLINYSVKEGGQSNAVVTNLGYEMINGGPDDQENLDREDDPVERSETITVSRDVQARSYTIEHTYAINFGNEFDLVTDHPAYANDPTYASVDARLTLGANEANKAFKDPIDYTDYIDLNGFATENGWDQQMMQDNCMGAFQTSSETKDFINGNYSQTLTRTVRYTGEDIDQNDTEPYELQYSMSFESREVNKTPCAVATMEGTVTSTSSAFGDCGNQVQASDAAQSGYDKFVVNGPAKTKLVNWFNTIAPSVGIKDQLNNSMVNLKKQECVPSVQKGEAKNDGVINFSFEMNNCPGEKMTDPDENGDQYPYSETSTESFSYSKQKDCDDIIRNVTNSTFSKSISANSSCAQNIDENGEHALANTISSVSGPSTAGAKGTLRSSSISESPYQGSQSWSYSYSDAPDTENCDDTTAANGCYTFNTSTSKSASTSRTVTAQTSNGPVTQKQGRNAERVTTNVSLSVLADQCQLDTDALKDEMLGILEANAPGCVTTDKSWSISYNHGSPPSMQGSIGGIESQ